MNTDEILKEFEQKFCHRAPQDNTSLQEIERWYAARDWLRTLLTSEAQKREEAVAELTKEIYGISYENDTCIECSNHERIESALKSLTNPNSRE